MMRLRRPLSLQILVWAALNLVLLAAAVALLFQAQFHFNLAWAFSASGGQSRLEAVRQLVIEELNAAPPDEWHEIVQRYGAAYSVPFSLFDDRARFLVGVATALPAEVRAHLRAPLPGASERPGSPPGELIRTASPTAYWLLTRGWVVNPQIGEPMAVALVAKTSSLAAGGFLFEVRPWLWLALGAAVFSFLLWLPLVRGITRALAEVVEATRRIADGRFEVRVQLRRRDELGLLAAAINQMATRLDDQTKGQKRFLGDVAHELCSPLARLRLALGILEQRASPEQLSYVQTASQKAEQIATLVDELLLFSKASFGAAALRLQPVQLRAVAEEALAREECPLERVELGIPAGLRATADPDLLVRALANLIRNALRYAGPGTPISLYAYALPEGIELVLTDAGPGIPELDLPRIFDPFYRVDPSRTSQTGGTGLGLTIVKSCVESCGGSVSARVVLPHGLAVSIRLPPG